MKCILALSALGLFVLAGTSSAQQASGGASGSSGAVVQSGPGTVVTSSPSSGRLFGRFRRGNTYEYGPVYYGSRRGILGRRTTTTQARVDTTPTTQTAEEKLPNKPTPSSTKTETSGDKAKTTTTTTTYQPVEQTTTTSGRRFFNGDFMARLRSRFGR